MTRNEFLNDAREQMREELALIEALIRKKLRKLADRLESEGRFVPVGDDNPAASFRDDDK